MKQVNALKKRVDQQRKHSQLQEQEKLEKAREVDRALFDFDEDIDNLEEVDERYPADNNPVQQVQTVHEEDRSVDSEELKRRREL